MAVKRSSSRSRRFRKSVSQHLSEMSQKEDAEKKFADQKKQAGEVERTETPQVGGGEGEKKKWWKAITTTKTNASPSTTSADSDS